MMACDGAGSKRERTFHSKLDATRRAKLEDGKLVLLNEDGEVLARLEAVKEFDSVAVRSCPVDEEPS